MKYSFRFIGPFILFALPVIFGASLLYGAEFEKAKEGRILSFPQDHGKHPSFETEWWYFTGNLTSGDRKWGTQLTFFRRSLFDKNVKGSSSWSVRDLYPGHFAITDITGGNFFHSEIISREGPGLAEAASDRLSVRVKDWRASMDGSVITLRAADGPYEIDLSLTPEKPIILHGNNGFSIKGNDPDQASYYYSFTRLKAEGALVFNGSRFKVTGSMWMDHEFGSSILTQEQVGWDWFSLQFDNGTELMAFYLRRKDGANEKPFATFVDRSGKPTHLSGSSVSIKAGGSWVSPRTRAKYPNEWTIEIPEKKLRIIVSPAIKDQELSNLKSTQTSYWEGVVVAKGTFAGEAVQGTGYVELTGYSKSMGGQL
jgi:predicted secreted hydrolase